MPESTVRIKIPMESLLESISKLNLKEKLRLWGLLEQQIAQADEDRLDQDPKIRAAIQAAREDYRAGDYLTVDEYISRGRRKAN
jgi:hypothetical protein